MSFWHFGNLKSGYGRSEFDRQMPGAELSYTITSRELVKQVPRQQRVPCPLLLFGVCPNPPIRKESI